DRHRTSESAFLDRLSLRHARSRHRRNGPREDRPPRNRTSASLRAKARCATGQLLAVSFQRWNAFSKRVLKFWATTPVTISIGSGEVDPPSARVQPDRRCDLKRDPPESSRRSAKQSTLPNGENRAGGQRSTKCACREL